ncbi:MAG: hypothetical protein D6749_09975 [Chloroflexota bacterium]|nr:MAG: hypothetical protein D6749_09975 [Chloroflexota bacterium]
MTALSHRRNPIFWQEITHQRRAAPRSTWIGKVVPPVLLLAILIGVPLSLSNPIIAFRHSREFALVAIWATHAIVAVRCIIAGANTVSREHVSQTWDALVLTGLSARQILLGKWFAALRRVAPWILALGAVRLAMLPVLMIAFVHRFAYFAYRRYSSYSLYDDYQMPTVEWLPWAVYTAVVLTVLITLVEAACCTMLGIFASTLFKRGALAAAMAFIVRFTPVAIFAGFTRYELGAASYRWYRFAPFAFADGGTSPLYMLILPLTTWTRGRHVEALGTYSGVLLMLLGATAIAFMLTLWLMRRSGALSGAAR